MTSPPATTELPQRDVRVPTAVDVAAARNAQAGVLPPTPLLPAPRLRGKAWIKAESMQPTGSFKPRGALAALAAIKPGQSVITASAGNAAIGIAWAAQKLARQVTVVVPQNASPAKLAKLTRYDVAVERYGRSFDDAEAHAVEVSNDRAAHYLSSYNDTALIAGYSTLGDELDALDGPKTVVCPVGGGGLISGLCTWAGSRRDVTLVGVEAVASRAMSAALAAGRVVPVPVGSTIADGLAGNIESGSITVQIARRVDLMVDVQESEIAEAIRFLATEHGLVAEGAGAVATAAVLFERVPHAGTVIAVLSGANIAPPLFAEVLGDLN